MSNLPIPINTLAQHVLLLGKTRSGKSSKMRLFVEHFLDRDTPVCIIDPKGDWWGLKSSADGKKAGYAIIIFGSEWAKFADVRINKHSGAEIGQLVATGNRPCIIDMKGMTVGDRTQFFIDFADAYFRHAEGKRVLAIDEVHNFAPQGKIVDPRAGMALHWANRLISEGGGMGITMISASQRPQKVHKDYASSHETLIACRAVHKLDRDASGDWVDACGDPAVKKDLLGTLAGMKREEAWAYSPEVGFGPKRVVFPMFRTYDSFKPQEARKSRRLKGWASVNLKEIEGKIAKVVEEAKANDPAVLKKQLADLRRENAQLKAKSAPPPAPVAKGPVIDKKSIEAAEKRGFERAKTEAMRQAKKIVEEAVASIEKDLTPLEEAMRGALHGFRSKTADRLKALVRDRQALLPVYKPAPQPAAVPPASSSIVPKTPARLKQAPPIAATGADGEISRSEQKVLDSLATWKQLGHAQPANPQVAWLAGYSPQSSTYQNLRGALRSKGLVDYPAGDLVQLTVEGEAVAVAIAIDHPLLEFVASKLKAGEERVLRAAAGAYPEAILNEQCAAAANYSASSSTYQNLRGALRSKGLLTYPGSDQVRAVDWVMS